MDVSPLHRLVARASTRNVDYLAAREAVNQIAARDIDGIPTLFDILGLDALPALVEAGVPPSMLRIAIEIGIKHHWDLPGFIERIGGRAVFMGWCRAACFSLTPDELPPVLDLFRGTFGIDPATAAAGLHWSLAFENAAQYAIGRATHLSDDDFARAIGRDTHAPDDDDRPGPIVLHARVPREGVAAFIYGNLRQEVIPAEAPVEFVVITDRTRIFDAAMASLRRLSYFGTLPRVHDFHDHLALARTSPADVPTSFQLVL